MRRSVPELATSAHGPLVGREDDLAALRQNLQRGGLVSLVGPPGVGKTRLCAELLRDGLGADSDPTLCDLLEAQSSEDVSAVVAHAMQVSLDGADAARSIADALAARHGAVLVLDNFEHLVESASSLVDAWSRGGTVLVLSRQKLGLPREVCQPLLPLALPQSAADDTPLSPAERLFADRFRLSHPSYTLTVGDRAAIRKLVVELDGLPLAIELSAAGARPPVAESLDAHGETAPSTLLDILGASFESLTDAERTMLRRCSVFRGGFDDAAAHAVSGLERSDQSSSALVGLVDKSLLLAQSTQAHGRRYSLLAMVREFATTRLTEAGEETQAENLHAKHFTVLSKRSTELYLRGASAEARRLVRRDADNLLVVHRRAIQDRLAPEIAASAAVECVLGVLPALGSLGPLTGLVSRLDACLSRFANELDTTTETRALIARSRILDHIGRPAEALGSAKLARDRARELGDRSLEARACDVEGRSLLQLGRWQDAKVTLLRAIAELGALGMDSHVARAQIALGDVAYYIDDLSEAEAAYRLALAATEALSDPALIGIALARLAVVEMELGQSEAALSRFEAALRQQEEAGDRGGAATTSTYLAVLEQDRGRLDVARARLETLAVVTRELGQRRLLGVVGLYLGSVLLEIGETEEALRTLTEAERVLGETASSSALALARAWKAAVLASGNDLEGAQQALDLALGVLRTKKEQTFYQRAAELHAGHLDLALARAADAAGDPLGAAARRANAKRRLESVKEPYQTDVRIARRALERAIGQWPRAQSEPPPASQRSGLLRALLVEETGAWFRPPTAAEPVDISQRMPLRKLLAELIDARMNNPGQVVTTATLFRAAWNDTTELATLQNRLRVAIATLRKLGLATHLYTRSGGYLLDPQKPVLSATEPG